ncbi:DUF262 domain-containing protein [Volucribacter amazonae]|uniref:DUF262 domain-containing protein n=1 Tax=Volucribacter amazonae TaxID=256731 RepID=A0A9X4PAQ4_9PAST|nr:DUF262 domain-containing HNH endonuclease family protein [Volucribacter amazonae]MDG6894204.1 hypothetical protein [Volucribacter amazonae]
MLEKLTIKELSKNQDNYIIPIYQRNYAWGKDEIEQLLSDIKNACTRSSEKNYYIGSLVVSDAQSNNSYEVVDGQQRLTTLKILSLAIENLKVNEDYRFEINLSFEHRATSNDELEGLKNQDNANNPLAKNNISLAYQLIVNYLQSNLLLPEDKDKFFQFLSNKVILFRNKLAKDTDLNHYFEIMNNRGEQLEQSEIIKARLMGLLKSKQEQACFAYIWDCCANMNNYIEHKIKKEDKINIDNINDFCQLSKKFENISETEHNNKKTILDILTGEKDENNEEQAEQTELEKYYSIIDFPNFLMHVLKLFVSETKGKTEEEKNIPLDNTKLINKFDDYFTKNKNDNESKSEDKVKNFIIKLLKYRLLFDSYIIKLENNNARNFVLYSYNNKDEYKNTFENEKEHNNIIMLLSMFDVSFRAKTYKNWLYYTLKYLSFKNKIEAKDYIKFLQHFAYKQYEKIKETNKIEDNFLHQGTNTPHYVFFYLDYLLWQKYQDNKDDNEFHNIKTYLDINNFRFVTSRNSIEHYLPQSKENKLGEKEKQDNLINDFGNLCLIPHNQNASLSNNSIEDKKRKYQHNELQCVSIKQAIMLTEDNWEADEIKNHSKEMIKLINHKPEQLEEYDELITL